MKKKQTPLESNEFGKAPADRKYLTTMLCPFSAAK